MKTSITLTNLLRNDLGKFFLSPPSLGGFCVANILVVSESIEKVLFNSGIKISARWSRHAFKPSKTDWVAKFNSSSKIQYPDFIAAKRGPSCHSKHIELFPSEGKSLPIKSLISVCSDKLIRTNVFPVNEANAVKVNYFKKRFFLISNYTNISNNSNFPPILFEMTFSLKNDNLEKILKLQVLS